MTSAEEERRQRFGKMEKTETKNGISMGPEMPEQYGICRILRTPGADPMQMLAEAIVVQAAEDYREALRKLKINPVNGEALRMKKECERFFRSRWYRMLTRVNSRMIMRRIQEEMENDRVRTADPGLQAGR